MSSIKQETLSEYRRRAEELVSRMTLEEKVSQMLHSAPAIPRLGIKEYNWWNEALHGVARAGIATVFPQAIGIAATFDESLIEEIASAISTEARAKLAGATTVSDKAKADEELTSALNRLMVVVENYPDLKSSQNFIQLSDELSGTENRIATARRDYNEAVKAYNLKIKRFPTNLMAGMFGYGQRDYFEASEQSKEVPNVNFE